MRAYACMAAGLLAAWMLTGCGAATPIEDNASTTTTTAATAATVQPVAALLYLGGVDNVDAGRDRVFDRYFDGQEPAWWPQVDTVEREGWQEAYLLLPRYDATTITIHALDTEERVQEELLTAYGPVLLLCNASDILPSLEVTLQHGEDTVVFRPRLSMRGDGMIDVPGLYVEDCSVDAPAAQG